MVPVLKGSVGCLGEDVEDFGGDGKGKGEPTSRVRGV